MKAKYTAAPAAIIVAASMACATHSLNAAVQIANNVVVSSTVDVVSVSAALPHGAGSQKFRITGNAAALSGSVPSVGALQYTGSSLLDVDGNGSGNDVQTFNSLVTHTMQFSLAAGEYADISFTGSYSLASAFLSSQVSWILTGPGAVNLWTPTTIALAAPGSPSNGNINEQVLGVGSPVGGNYILTLVTRTSGSTPSKVANLAAASLSNLDFTVTPVPEPGALGFFCAAACMAFARRRRI